MSGLIKGILAFALSAVGLQIVAEKFDFSTAKAEPSFDPEDMVGGNGSIGW